MKRMTILLALAAALFLANNAHAQGKISFDSGYPAKGCSAGTLSVAGTFTLDCGWSLTSSTVTVRVWQDGDVVSTFSISAGCASFLDDITITGLVSCATYNVTAEVTVSDGCLTRTISTIPVTATAP